MLGVGTSSALTGAAHDVVKQLQSVREGELELRVIGSRLRDSDCLRNNTIQSDGGGRRPGWRSCKQWAGRPGIRRRIYASELGARHTGGQHITDSSSNIMMVRVDSLKACNKISWSMLGPLHCWCELRRSVQAASLTSDDESKPRAGPYGWFSILVPACGTYPSIEAGTGPASSLAHWVRGCVIRSSSLVVGGAPHILGTPRSDLPPTTRVPLPPDPQCVQQTRPLFNAQALGEMTRCEVNLKRLSLQTRNQRDQQLKQGGDRR